MRTFIDAHKTWKDNIDTVGHVDYYLATWKTSQGNPVDFKEVDAAIRFKGRWIFDGIERFFNLLPLQMNARQQFLWSIAFALIDFDEYDMVVLVRPDLSLLGKFDTQALRDDTIYSLYQDTDNKMGDLLLVGTTHAFRTVINKVTLANYLQASGPHRYVHIHDLLYESLSEFMIVKHIMSPWQKGRSAPSKLC